MLLSLKTTPRQEADDGYLAGIIDGEGSIFVYRRRDKRGGTSHILSLAITMTCEEVIRKIEHLYGGRVLPLTTPGKSPSWRWHVENEAALEMIKIVFPYLVAKKKQASLAFKFREVMKQTFGSPREHRWALRDDLMRQINSLNQNKGGGRSRLALAVETARETPLQEMIQSELHSDVQKDDTDIILQ
jgi:hypothetical protein